MPTWGYHLCQHLQQWLLHGTPFHMCNLSSALGMAGSPRFCSFVWCLHLFQLNDCAKVDKWEFQCFVPSLPLSYSRNALEKRWQVKHQVSAAERSTVGPFWAGRLGTGSYTTTSHHWHCSAVGSMLGRLYLEGLYHTTLHCDPHSVPGCFMAN